MQLTFCFLIHLQRHHGNATFRKLIHANVSAYIQASTKNDKTLVVKSIVDVIRQNGGRFVKQDSDGRWHDIGDSQAKEKVGHSLRDQVTALSKQKKDFASSSRTPRRTSSNSVSSFSQTSLGQVQGSPSPLNILSQLPSDLSGLLDQISFPSIHASERPPHPQYLGASSSSFASAGHHHSFQQSQHFPGEQQGFAGHQQIYERFSQSLNFEPSTQNFNGPRQSSLGASVSSLPQRINFHEPLDDDLEPIPLREVGPPKPDIHPQYRHPGDN
jgi:hypothetical protein